MFKIKDLFNLEKGSLQSSKCTPGEFDFITASKDWKTHNEFTHDLEALIFAAAASGSLGRTHYVNGKFITSDLCFIITPKEEKKFPIDLPFYHIIFNTLKEDIVKNTKAGTSKEAIGLKSLGEYKLPYFDLEKQRSISRNFLSLTETKDFFSEEVSNQLSLINQLRQSFLREAMQGKLVSNETTDGKTGSDLLKEIKAEKEKLIKEKKLKKSKSLPPISEEEIPFEIPENWVWCRLGEVINLISGQDLMPSQYNDKEIGIPYITGASNLENQKVLVNRWTDTPKSIAKNGDLLLTCKGSGVGKTAMLDINEAHIARQIMSIQTINSPLGYIYLIVKSSVNFFRSKSKSLIPGIDRDTVLNLVIPFPPLEIQEKIVTKLDELMQYCDDLEASVKESQTYNEQLLQQVLREALEGKKEEVAEPVLMVAEEKPIFQINSVTSKTCDDNDMVILAGYIIKKLNTKDFGRVKLQKMLHLVEYHCKLETNIYYQQKVAGPHSEYLKNTIEPKLKRYRYFEIHKEKLTVNEKITYTALSSSSEIESLLSKEFKDQKQTIDDLLNKFYNKPTRHCELISTMYAVWNNRILSKKPFSDEDLKQDFLKWDKEKVKFNDNLDYAIDWIRKEALEPKGWGKVIGKL